MEYEHIRHIITMASISSLLAVVFMCAVCIMVRGKSIALVDMESSDSHEIFLADDSSPSHAIFLVEPEPVVFQVGSKSEENTLEQNLVDLGENTVSVVEASLETPTTENPDEMVHHVSFIIL